MKTTDISRLKGQLKDAALSWVGKLIDQMLPDRITARALLKNAAGNLIARYSQKIDGAVDAAFLMFGDSTGTIDTDTMVDRLCEMLQEMPPTDYAFGPFGAKVGKGELVVEFPQGFVADLLAGSLGGVRLTTEDIKGFKNFLS